MGLKSVSNCKICDKPFITHYSYCKECGQYSIIFTDDGEVESETISSKNFYLIFFPKYKEANVVSTTDEDGDKKLLRFEINELTPTLASQWAKKLKTYAIFQ